MTTESAGPSKQPKKAKKSKKQTKQKETEEGQKAKEVKEKGEKKTAKSAKSIAPSEPKSQSAYFYPWLHPQIARKLKNTAASNWEYERSKKAQFINAYHTHIMGTFTCHNKSCDKDRWTSKKVAIEIRRYQGEKYNAMILNQRCASCRQLGGFELDNKSYIERVVYRIKKWAGVEVEKAVFGEAKGDPHRRDLCEGCRRGICCEE